MAINSPEDFLLRVSSDGGTTWLTVANATQAGRSGSRTTNRRKVFGAANQLLFPQDAERTLSAQGLADDADPGQVALLAAFESGGTIDVLWLPDGTDGSQFSGVVSNFSQDVAADGDAMEFSVEFAVDGAPVAFTAP